MLTYFTITFRRTPTSYNVTESFTTNRPQDFLQEDEHNQSMKRLKLVMSPHGKKELNLVGQGIVIYSVYELTQTHQNIYYSNNTCSNALLYILKPRIIEVMMD